jgi:hypothetical protein
MPRSFVDFFSEMDAEAHADGLARQLAVQPRQRRQTQKQVADL